MANFSFWDVNRGNILTSLPMSLVASSQSIGGVAQISGAGLSPGATGADNVIAVYSVPANSFAAAGNGIYISAYGSFANNSNTKRIKIIINPLTAVVGQTVGSLGTTIGDTGSYSTTGTIGFAVESCVYKYGALGSNTQIGLNSENIIAATNNALITPQLITANESGPILVAVTGNAGSAVADILLNAFIIQAIS